MMQPRSLLPLLALALVACQAPPLVSDADLAQRDIAKPIKVDHVRVAYDAAFRAGSSQLSKDETARLDYFLDQSGVRASDHVFVAAPPGDALAAERIARIKRLLAERSVGIVPVPPPPKGVAPNHLLIEVDRFIAVAPPCPDWSGSPMTQHENTPRDNFGCATASDLAAMVANPRDLVTGEPLGPADAEPAILAIDRYRADKVKPLLGEGQQSGPPGQAGGGYGSGGGMSDAGGSGGSNSSNSGSAGQ